MMWLATGVPTNKSIDAPGWGLSSASFIFAAQGGFTIVYFGIFTIVESCTSRASNDKTVLLRPGIFTVSNLPPFVCVPFIVDISMECSCSFTSCGSSCAAEQVIKLNPESISGRALIYRFFAFLPFVAISILQTGYSVTFCCGVLKTMFVSNTDAAPVGLKIFFSINVCDLVNNSLGVFS